MLCLGGVILCFPVTVNGSEFPTIVYARDGKSPNGEPFYALTIKTADGFTISGLAEPNRLTFDISGDMVDGKRVPFLAVPKAPGQGSLSEQENELKEVGRRLLATSGDFVAPGDVKLDDRGGECIAVISFTFLGEEDPGRRIDVSLQLKNINGAEMETRKGRAEDERIHAAQRRKAIYGGQTVRYSHVNKVRFEFDHEMLKDIDQVTVILENVPEPIVKTEP
jgi:hypothetical protein